MTIALQAPVTSSGTKQFPEDDLIYDFARKRSVRDVTVYEPSWLPSADPDTRLLPFCFSN